MAPPRPVSRQRKATTALEGSMRRGRGAGGEGRGAWGEGRGAGGGREGEGERVPPYAPQPQEPSPSLLGRAALGNSPAVCVAAGKNHSAAVNI